MLQKRALLKEHLLQLQQLLLCEDWLMGNRRLGQETELNSRSDILEGICA